MSKATKARATITMTVDYDLNDEDIESIKNRLEDSIRYMVGRGGLAGDVAKDAIVDTWLCKVEVEEKD